MIMPVTNQPKYRLEIKYNELIFSTPLFIKVVFILFQTRFTAEASAFAPSIGGTGCEKDARII
jgi:hypothetical protein